MFIYNIYIIYMLYILLCFFLLFFLFGGWWWIRVCHFGWGLYWLLCHLVIKFNNAFPKLIMYPPYHFQNPKTVPRSPLRGFASLLVQILLGGRIGSAVKQFWHCFEEARAQRGEKMHWFEEGSLHAARKEKGIDLKRGEHERWWGPPLAHNAEKTMALIWIKELARSAEIYFWHWFEEGGTRKMMGGPWIWGARAQRGF